MVTKKLLGSLGVGGPTVGTVLEPRKGTFTEKTGRD